MGSGLRFVAAALFMIATASFLDAAMKARTGDEHILPAIGAGLSLLLVLVMTVWGIIAGMREHRKDGA